VIGVAFICYILGLPICSNVISICVDGTSIGAIRVVDVDGVLPVGVVIIYRLFLLRERLLSQQRPSGLDSSLK